MNNEQQMGGDGEAVGALEEVVKLDPLDGEALFLAQHYRKSTHPGKAVFYDKRAGNIEKLEAEVEVRRRHLSVTSTRSSASPSNGAERTRPSSGLCHADVTKLPCA